MPDENEPVGEPINRRRLIQAIGAASAAGLAGCGGSGGDGGDGGGDTGGGDTGGGDTGGGDTGSGGSGGSADLGERVPTIQIEYWSDYGGFTTTQEQMLPVIRRGIEEHLGVDVEIVPVDISTQLGQLAADENRTVDITFGWWVPTMDRLDPQELFNNLRIEWAGANGNSNYWNYADCQYTDLLIQQSNAGTQDERQNRIDELLAYASDQGIFGDLCPVANIGAWRTDRVDMQGIGNGGIVRSNAEWAMLSESMSGEDLVVAIDPIATETLNWLTHHASMPEAMWQHMISSPVQKYDHNFELRGLLGDVETSAQEVTVELYDDAAFTNGDPVTAEDVKFTFEQIIRGGEAGAYPGAAPVPYEGGSPQEGISIVDEQTVQFSFSEPYLPFAQTTLMRWGVLHKESFEAAGAVDDPAGAQFELPLVTSGPFEVTDFQQGQRVVVEARDNHSVFEPNQGIIFNAYRNEESAIQALQAGEADVLPEISPPNAQRINDQIENAEAAFAGAHTTYILQPVCHIAPSKFRPFRRAVNAVLNRQEMIAIAFDGAVEPEMYGTYISQNHPFYPSEDVLEPQADDPTGSPEMGRGFLEEAGWGWDDNGNLRYPADADLEPLWAQGEVPSEDDFPCLSELRG